MSAIPGTGRQGLHRKLSPEMKKIVTEAECLGWRLQLSGGKHLQLRHPTGRSVTFAYSPSDWRAYLNARSIIRRKLREIPV